MSGVIGGAGSKSGVIGQTEIDYEEGTWTCTNGTGSGYTVTHVRGYYIKIGNQVHVFGYVTNSGTASGTMKIGGIPFVPNLTSRPNYYPHGVAHISSFSPTAGVLMRARDDSTFGFRHMDNNTAVTQAECGTCHII